MNARKQGGYTPLHEAAANGQVEMVKLLLSHGADVTCASDDGKTAIDLAQEKKGSEYRRAIETGYPALGGAFQTVPPILDDERAGLEQVYPHPAHRDF